MARRGKRRKSVSGYFRQAFEQHPDWLREKSNDLVLAKYREDHNMAPEAKIKLPIRNNLANIKSLLRKEKNLGSFAGRKSGRNKKAGSLAQRLELLETQIDECMMTARSIDPALLEHIIKHLLQARREVVWKMG